MSRTNITKNASNPRRAGQAGHSKEMEERIKANLRRRIAEIKYQGRKGGYGKNYAKRGRKK